MKILTESTPMALWYQALQEAQSRCQIILQTDLESYLVLMLMRYMTYDQLAKEIMAVNFLKGMQYPARQRENLLQDVGDRCLLISGLFPATAERRQVKLGYYIDMGQISYGVISREKDDLFSSLSKHFVPLMSVLQSFRPCVLEQLSLEIQQIWKDPQQPKGSKKP